MTSCDPFQTLIHEALDARLDHADQARLDAHLAACAACNAEAASLASIHDRLAEPIQAPAALMERLGLAELPASPRRRAPAWAYGIAATFVAAFGLGLWQLAPGEAPTTLASAPLAVEAPVEPVLSWLEPEVPAEVELPSDAFFAEGP